MSSPQIPQGVLNRLAASITWNAYPQLNVTPPFLGREQISLGFEGEATTFIKTATGVVISPEPYQMISLTINLLKTQPLAPLYETQRQTNSALGNGTVRPDVGGAQAIANLAGFTGAAGLGPYSIVNCGIMNVRELRFSGEDAGYIVLIGGYLPLNSALWG
jgi:hypothetical protein